MFGKPSDNELNRENEKLKKKVEDLERLITAHNDKLRKDAFDDVRNSSFSIDFDAMNVCSVERMVKSTLDTVTIIGHIKDEGKVSADGKTMWSEQVIREWTLYCSHDEHERLVARFNEWKAQKGKSE